MESAFKLKAKIGCRARPLNFRPQNAQTHLASSRTLGEESVFMVRTHEIVLVTPVAFRRFNWRRQRLSRVPEVLESSEALMIRNLARTRDLFARWEDLAKAFQVRWGEHTKGFGVQNSLSIASGEPHQMVYGMGGPQGEMTWWTGFGELAQRMMRISMGTALAHEGGVLHKGCRRVQSPALFIRSFPPASHQYGSAAPFGFR